MKYQYTKKKMTFAQMRSKVAQIIAFRGLNISTAMDSQLFASLFIRVACQRVKGFNGKGLSRIWMLGKDGHTEDMLSSLARDKWASPIEFSRGIPKVIAKHYLPPGVDDNNYESDNEVIENAKIRYRKAWQDIFRYLKKDKPNAITTGNFGYYAERELAAAAEMEGIPFIAMHKECLKSEGRLSFFKTVYQRRGRFKGRKILVYNNRERKLQILSGIAQPEQVVVCGMPRLDRIHRWRKKIHSAPKNKPTLLALGFMPKTGLPRIPRKGVGGSTLATYEYLDPEHETLGWDKFFQNYHEVLVKIAVDNPGFLVQLKLKVKQRDAEPSVRLVKSLNPPENFHIIVGGDPINMIQRADVVCGFNTTAVLEGLAAGLPVVTPEFDEVIDPKLCDFAANFGDATYRPGDPKAMYSILTELLNRRQGPNRELSNTIKDVLDVWVSNSDGRAGQRVKDVFEKEMKK
jgi:hypothetical protein